MRINIRIKKEGTKTKWQAVKNTKPENCDTCGHKLWIAPDGKTLYCDNTPHTKEQEIKSRLEYIRGEIRAERISYGEIAELQSLAEHIAPDDTELLEWAGVDEQNIKTREAALDEFHSLRNDDPDFLLQYDEDEFEDWVKDQEIKII